MKKILCIVFALLMVLACAGCGNEGTSTESGTDAQSGTEAGTQEDRIITVDDLINATPMQIIPED